MSMSVENLRRLISEDEYGLLDVKPKNVALSADDRLLSAFSEIVEFVNSQSRLPSLESSDMIEVTLALRLRSMTDNEEQRQSLKAVDKLGLLIDPEPPESLAEVLATDIGGLLSGTPDDIFTMKNVPKFVTVPDKIARRKPCEDFSEFEPLFKKCHAEIQSGDRRIITFRREQQIRPDTYYVLKGVLVYIAAAGARIKEHGRINARLRCIFENGTEADMLLRSLSSRLYRFGKMVTEPETLTLASMSLAPDTPMATVYVLKSLNESDQLREYRDVHKIGSTKQTVASRVAEAIRDTTFLNAPVEIVAEYRVPTGVEKDIEHLLHRVFSAARLDIWIEREGETIAEAHEWFAVPLKTIDTAISLIESEAIKYYEYDPDSRVMKLRP